MEIRASNSDVYHAFKENGTSNIIEPYQQYDIKIDNGSLTIEEKMMNYGRYKNIY